jgi:guanylate kinase
VNTTGANKLVDKAFSANFLFIYPRTIEELRNRIANRQNEKEEEFKDRIAEAIREIERANKSVLFNNRLMNGELDLAVD